MLRVTNEQSAKAACKVLEYHPLKLLPDLFTMMIEET